MSFLRALVPLMSCSDAAYLFQYKRMLLLLSMLASHASLSDARVSQEAGRTVS